jgi:hypothetical protein
VNPGRIWARAEYLLWWIRGNNLPPLVTTSPSTSLGVLGAPGTTVLIGGDQNNGSFYGGRFTLGFWFDRCETCGLEAGYFFLSQRSVQTAVASSGTPLLARPFFNAATGGEDAELTATGPVPGIPGVLPTSGMVAVSRSSRLWGTELNAVYNLCRGCRCNLDLLGGFRYLELDESLSIDEMIKVDPASPMFPGTTFVLDDKFKTRNQFYGEQLGLRATMQRGRWGLELQGKLGLGVTHEVADVSGFTMVTPPGGATTTFPGGLLTQPTNIGHYDRDKFAVVPELGINLTYQVTPHMRLIAGYNFLYWSNVVRPEQTIDRVVNPTQLTGGTLVGTPRPSFVFKDTDFWATGLNFGLEFRY